VRDLGAWWEEETGAPIPLGAILANASTVDPGQAADWIRQSVRHAWAHPADSRDYVLAHAQELEPAVVDQHIGLYVNEFTEDLGAEGFRAVRTLLDRSAAAGLTPPVSLDAVSA
jgi:1,4-dihydroxy-6-naphthoate synthase